MTRGLQQQDSGLGLCIPKTAPTPQHGQKAPRKPLPVPETRTFKPRPGH